MSTAWVNIDKYKNFMEWYHAVLREADIVDIRYPVKGMIVWRPYGLKALRLTQKILVDLLEGTGHEEGYFPTMIPESVFSLEKEFLEGFGGETFVVEGTATKKFNERLFVRPTSETVMYYMWSMWIKGKKHLPLKMYQVVNVFRYETKMTHPLLRVREIMSFIEAHTAHSSMEEAEAQVREAIGIYKQFFDSLLLPYIIVKTPPWDTFAGAEYNYDFITAMPDGKGLELGSVINLGQRFAKAFNIQFTDDDGTNKYVYQTCYGVSERVLGAVIGIHGDEAGLIFPPRIAPIQVVIVPIMKQGEEDILEYARDIAKRLKELGIRAHVDEDLEKTPGWKYHYWEMKGVPTRLEIGRRELQTRTATIASRDRAPKATVPLDNLAEALRERWAKLEEYLRARGLEHLKRMVKSISEVEDPKAFRGLLLVPWDGSKTCAERIEAETGKNLLGEVVESPIPLPSPSDYKICDGEADRVALVGVTY